MFGVIMYLAKYVQICMYMVCTDSIVIVMCPCMLLVGYCMVYYWMNVCASVVCLYYMSMPTLHIFQWIYVQISWNI